MWCECSKFMVRAWEAALDQKTTEYMYALNEEIERLWRYLGHTDAAEKSRREATEWQRRTDELRKELESVLVKTSQQFSQNMTASAVIGYAGYFTTWNFTRELLQPNQASFVALMGIASIGVFVLWEIFIINARMKSIGEMSGLLRDMVAPEYFEERRVEIVRREATLMRIATPIWRLVITFCIGTMLSGGSVLAYALIRDL